MEGELRNEILAGLGRMLREGFGDHEHDIIESAVEQFTDGLDDATSEEVAAEMPMLYRQAHAHFEREKAGWPPVTDCDRLDAAFDELNELGILARHHWWCCQNCGHAAMPDERDATQARGAPARGYAFYHVQDTEAAVDGAGVFLAYGSFEKATPEVQVASEVVQTLTRHGLEPRWDGSVKARIRVPLSWQRRAR